jgi:hypothetical protein
MMFLLLVLAATPSAGTVTLPLDEARSFLSTDQEPIAPISAAVSSQHLSGQVAGDSLEVTASFVITVLEGSTWSRLSLLKLDPNVMLVDATRAEGMLITAQRGDVVFVSRRPGTYPVELKLSVRSSGSPVHTAKLTRGADARDGFMEVEQSLEETSQVSSLGGTWSVSWKGRASPLVATARPPMEPVVNAAHVQVVSTVEGRARMTVEYRLGLDRDQSLAVRLPADWTLTRVNCNGAPRAVPEGRVVTLPVSPQATGGREGLVELTLERDFGVFHLSGRLALSLPGVSWPTSVVEASVHLPNVFEYRRQGGSLEPIDALEWAAPTMPGRALHFTQHLVASAGPTLDLTYSVDLEHRYFRVKGR